MISKQTIDTINTRIRCETFLQRSKTGSFICPYCGVGARPQKATAFILFRKQNEFHCLSCGASGGPIDLYRHKTGTDLETAVRQMAGELKIQTDEDLAHSWLKSETREKA